MTTAIKFALYADTSGGELACWPWTGARNENGYGLLRVDGRLEKAPRVALALDGRPVPRDQQACHECDNPPCVNPAHLYVGTHRQNVDDMIRRGRSNAGAKNGATKLTADDVRALRAARANGASYDDLMERYGIARATVSRIVRRQVWADA